MGDGVCLCLCVCTDSLVIVSQLNIDPDSMLPKLPKPAELRPFPTWLAIAYTGHAAAVRSVSVSPTGQWLASGDVAGNLRLWEVDTGRCLASLTLDWASDGIMAVAFNPNRDLPILAVAAGSKLLV